MFACIYIPDFAAEAALRADEALTRERPLAVLDGTPPLVHVVGMNEAARQAGIELGMTKLQAAAIETLQMRQRSLVQEEAAHRALMDCACGFSPKVEDAAADTALLDAAGLERVFGSPEKLAQTIAGRAAAMHMHCNVAIAGNLEAAMHAARGSPGVTVIAPGTEEQRLGELPIEVLLQEPLAARCSVIAETTSQTSKMKIHSCTELQETFDRWGVRTFRALALLPPVAVAERLGQFGVVLQKLARGESVRALNLAEAPLSFEEAMELEYPVDTLEPLAFLLNRMLEQLCARLESRALSTNELRLRLELEDNEDKIVDVLPRRGEAGNFLNCDFRLLKAKHCDTDRTIQKSKIKNQELLPAAHDRQATVCKSHSTSLCLPIPMRDAKVFLKLLQLELAAHPPSAPVTKIFLRAEPAAPQQAQHGLFTPLEPQPERLELMLARIAGIVGRERVGSADLENSHRPEAFRMTRFQLNSPRSLGGAEIRIQNSKFKIQTFAFDARRPPTNNRDHLGSSVIPQFGNAVTQRVFRPARAAEVQLHEGMPRHVMCAGEQGPRGAVTWAAGPWRSSGEWWNSATGPNAAWTREEWDVEIAGALYRLVKNEGKGWAVDGTYD